MIRRLFRASPRTPPRASAARVPEGTRVYAIGDIHGCLDLLRALQRKIVADAEQSDATRKCIVYLGDYVDRGLQSKEVVDFLIDSAPDNFEVVYLKGNHEEFMLRFLDDLRVGPGWLANGGNATLYSYGVRMVDRAIDVDRLASLQEQLREKVPDLHLRFLRGLARWHVEGDYLFVHAGVRPGVPLEEQLDEDILWIREQFLLDDSDHGKLVVHGHTITDRPDVRANRIGVDTGAYATGILTALVLEGGGRGFLQTSG